MPNAELSALLCGWCKKQGALLKCGKCKKVAYCNYKCQKAGWKEHKEVCGKKAAIVEQKCVECVASPLGDAEKPVEKDPVPMQKKEDCRQPIAEKDVCEDRITPAEKVEGADKPVLPEDPFNYKKWDAIVDSDDEAPADQKTAAEDESKKDPRIKKAESMVQVIEMEVDRLAKEIARVSGGGSLLNAKITGAIERDLRYCEKSLDEEVLPALPDVPPALFFHGVVHFLLRAAAKDQSELRDHHLLAKHSLLRCHDSTVLPVTYQLNASDMVGTLLQIDGEFERACQIVEQVSTLGSSFERYLLMARGRMALARTLSDDDERLRALRIARSYFERAIEARPQHERAYAELDIVLEDLGERQAQMSLVDRCIAEGVWWERRLQRPPHYVRGLTGRPWWDAAQFDFCRQLEEKFDIIKSEMLSLTAGPNEPSVWQHVGLRGNAGNHDVALVSGAPWKEAVLFGNCALSSQVRACCPETVAAITSCKEVADLIEVGLGEVLFSHIAPGCQISPHCGLTNMRLTCHLALVVPDGCSIQVGANESRTWEEGKCLVFDDSFEHSSMNAGAGDRYVLLLNFWHPDVPVSERPAMAAAVQGCE